MTAPQLLASVQARGVVLWRDGDALEVKMPEAVAADMALRARLLATLKAAKPQLLPLLASRAVEAPPAPVAASPRAAGGQTTPPNAQRGLLGAPDAKQGIPAGVEGGDEAPEVAAAMRRRIRAAVDQARAGTFPDLGPVELEGGRVALDPAAWLLEAVERLRGAVDALQQTRFGTPAYAERWRAAAGIVADMETIADWWASGGA